MHNRYSHLLPLFLIVFLTLSFLPPFIHPAHADPWDGTNTVTDFEGSPWYGPWTAVNGPLLMALPYTYGDNYQLPAAYSPTHGLACNNAASGIEQTVNTSPTDIYLSIYIYFTEAFNGILMGYDDTGYHNDLWTNAMHPEIGYVNSAVNWATQENTSYTVQTGQWNHFVLERNKSSSKFNLWINDVRVIYITDMWAVDTTLAWIGPTYANAPSPPTTGTGWNRGHSTVLYDNPSICTFYPITFTTTQMTLNAATGSGTIYLNGTDHTAGGTFYYNSTDTIVLQATAGTNYAFDYWYINTTGNVYENPYNLTMSSNCTVTAHFVWTGTHDVAVVNISSKSVVGQGFDFNVTVEAANFGTYQESFNLTLYTAIFIVQQNVTLQVASQNVTLESEDYANITFVVNTTGYPYGNYTISAYAWPVSGETNTADNNFTGGWVFVAGMGDLTGKTPNLLYFVPDGKVDMKDLGLVAKYFMQNVPPAPSNCDITGPAGVPDGKIDMRDIGLVAIHYGDHYTYP